MSVRHSVCLSILATAILLVRPAVVAASISYTVTDLGPVDASGINSLGQVTGTYSYLSDRPGHGFVWNNGHLTDLGFLGSPSAAGINNNGQVAGTSWTGSNPAGFIWSNGQFTDLGNLGSAVNTHATAINNNGQVVGSSATATLDHAFLYSNGHMSDLGTLGGDYSVAYAVNGLGQAAGLAAMPGSGYHHAFFYDGASMVDLGVLTSAKYAESEALGVNDAGQVVGDSNAGPTGGQVHAFLYNAGQMTDLGALGGVAYGSTAYGINNAGQIVGSSGTPESRLQHAFLYQNGAMTDLNSLIDPVLGITLENATGINDNGQIIAGGGADAYLLTPTSSAVPEPTGLALCFVAAGGLLLRRSFSPVREK